MPFGAGAYVVEVGGTLGEDCDLAERLSGLGGQIVVDLDGVRGVNSFGIRNWLEAFSKLRAGYFAYILCRPPLLRHFNMGDGF